MDIVLVHHYLEVLIVMSDLQDFECMVFARLQEKAWRVGNNTQLIAFHLWLGLVSGTANQGQGGKAYTYHGQGCKQIFLLVLQLWRQ